MSYSYSFSASLSETFSIAHAKRLTGKVLADLQRCQQLYGEPSDVLIAKYEAELVPLLHKELITSYEFGFKKDGERIVSWKYEVKHGELVAGTDDNPGGIYRRANITGASFFNFLHPSTKWFLLAEAEQKEIRDGIGWSRASGTEPRDGKGHWLSDRTYSAGGCSLPRKTFVPYS
jgi:hypothetical protein